MRIRSIKPELGGAFESLNLKLQIGELPPGLGSVVLTPSRDGVKGVFEELHLPVLMGRQVGLGKTFNQAQEVSLTCELPRPGVDSLAVIEAPTEDPLDVFKEWEVDGIQPNARPRAITRQSVPFSVEEGYIEATLPPEESAKLRHPNRSVIHVTIIPGRWLDAY